MPTWRGMFTVSFWNVLRSAPAPMVLNSQECHTYKIGHAISWCCHSAVPWPAAGRQHDCVTSWDWSSGALCVKRWTRTPAPRQAGQHQVSLLVAPHRIAPDHHQFHRTITSTITVTLCKTIWFTIMTRFFLLSCRVSFSSFWKWIVLPPSSEKNR